MNARLCRLGFVFLLVAMTILMVEVLVERQTGISRHPHNTLWVVGGISASIFGIVGLILVLATDLAALEH